MYCKQIIDNSPCSGPIKPNITFFGEGLPKEFFKAWDKIEDIDEKDEDDDVLEDFTKGMKDEIAEIEKGL